MDKTITTTVEVDKTENKVDNLKNSVKSPVFLMFAEFMGYCSPLIEWATQLCEGKYIEPFKENAIKIDAVSIFNKMKEEYSSNDIKELWDSFYDVVLRDYDENLEDLYKSRLPF